MNRKVELPRTGNSLFCLSINIAIYMFDNKPKVVVCKNFIDGII
ncbi:MAG: hypothetical protein ACFNUT_01940 [Bacteroidota bacterium]